MVEGEIFFVVCDGWDNTEVSLCVYGDTIKRMHISHKRPILTAVVTE